MMLVAIFLLLLLSLNYSLSLEFTCNLAKQQFDALHSLFVSLGGERWAWKSQNTGNIWNISYVSNSDPCSNNWQGIVCSNCTFNVSLSTENVLNQSVITTLNLSMYHLKGTIPGAAFLNLTSVKVMDLSNNSITGSIPSSIGLMSNLWNLHLEYNSLKGSIPTAIGLLQNSLVGLFVEYNKLSGSIPAQIIQATSLKYLYLKYNSLTGSIPSLIGHLSQLQYLALRNNKFVGSLPSSLIQLSSMIYISLNSNKFTGTIPVGIGNLTNLDRISLRTNQFIGTIPSSITNCRFMAAFRIDNNSFTGTLPSSISTLSKMNIFTVSNNKFVGNIDLLFNTTLQRNLQFVDISANQLTGTVPASLFNAPKLQVMSLTQNCFEGEVPSTICEATALQVLILDGLSSALDCRIIIAPSLSSAYITKATVSGSIPQCIWGLQQLSTFQASGNSIGGSLGDITLAPNSSLINVALSHNHITGTIPAVLLQWPFAYLDLGSNKFGGTLNAMNNISGRARVKADTLNLAVNRLSGNLPLGLFAFGDLNILSGNLFQCKHSTLPKNEPSATSYVCGSDELDTAMYLNVSVVGLIMLVFIGLMLRRLYCGSLMKDVSKRVEHGAAVNEQRAGGAVELTKVGSAKLTTKLASGQADYRIETTPGVVQPSGGVLKLFTVSLRAVRRWLASLSLSDSLENQLEKMIFLVFQCSLNDDQVIKFPNLNRFIGLIRQFRYLSLKLFLAYVIILLPVYYFMGSIRNSAFSTHAYEYGWKLSAAFFSGLPPAICFELLWLLSAGFVLWRGQQIKRALRQLGPPQVSTPPRGDLLDAAAREQQADSAADSNFNYSHKVRVWCLQLLLAAINILVIVTINVLYTRTQLSSLLNVSQKVAIQIFTAGVKLSWNLCILRFLVESIVSYNQDPGDKMGRYYLMMLAFNNVIIPCLVTAMENSNCFSSILNEPAPVSYAYSYSVCVDMPVLQPNGDYIPGCEAGIYAETTYINTDFMPPFSYSYQCGDAIITTYVPLFTYTYSILVLVGPIGNIILELFDEAKLPALLRRQMSAIFWPRADPALFKRVFDPDIEVVIMIQHMLIQLTFGVATAELAFAVCFSAVLSSLVTQVLLVRYVLCQRNKSLGEAAKQPPQEPQKSPALISIASSLGELVSTKWRVGEGGKVGTVVKTPSDAMRTNASSLTASQPIESIDSESVARIDLSTELVQSLEQSFSGSWLRLVNGLDIAFAVACVFYAAIIFDIAADKSGWQTGVLTVLPCLVAPFFLLAIRLISKDRVIQRVNDYLASTFRGFTHSVAEFGGDKSDRNNANDSTVEDAKREEVARKGKWFVSNPLRDASVQRRKMIGEEGIGGFERVKQIDASETPNIVNL